MDLNNSVGNKVFHAGDVFTGVPTKIKDFSNTIKVAYHGVNGTLRIYQSPNGKLWSYYEEFPVSGNSFAQSGINGNYYYVQYTNVTGTNTITLATNLSQQIHDNFNVQLDSGDTVTVAGLLFNEDGALIVSSTGGGVSADVNVTNTSLDVNVLNPTDVSGLALESTQSSIQTDLGLLKTFLLDSQLETTVLNPISNYATETTLDSIKLAVQGTLSTSVENQIDISALATSAKQDSILSDLDTILNSAAVIESNTTTYSASPVHLDLDIQGATIWADSTLPWTTPTNGENGWRYNNTTAGGAQCYFYANAPALVSGSQEPNITLGSVSSMYFVANHRLLIDNDSNHKFYLSIYTQPTGSGDAQFWYHSRKVYQLTQNQIMSKGADYFFYTGVPLGQLRRDLEHIELVLATQSGQCNPAEIVQFMAINVDSQVPQDQFDGVLKEAGFSIASLTTRTVIFDNSIARKAELALSKLNVNGDNELVVNVANQLTGFTFNGSNELLVSSSGSGGYADVNIKCNDVLLTQTPSGTKNCLDVSVDNWPASQVISGTVSIDNQPTVGLASGSQIQVINSEVGLLTGTTVGLTSGSQVQLISSEVALVAGTQIGISNFPSQQSVSVDNQPTVALAYGSQIQLLNSEVGLTAGAIVNLAYGSQVQLINSEVSIVSGSQIGINNFPQKQSVFVENSAEGFDINTHITNSSLAVTGDFYPATQPISGSVNVDNFPAKQSVFIENTTEGFDINTHITNSSLAVTGDFYQATQPVSIASAVDVHMYANGNGGSMHVVSCDSQGKLNINLHDDSGNGIASLATEADGRGINTVMFGYDAADDAIKRVKMGEGMYGGLYVENAPATNLVVGKGLPVYSALYSGALNAADNFGNLTVAEYSTCDIMIKIPANACSASGYLYVSFSEDGSAGSWFDTSLGVNINTSTSDKTYWLNVPNFNMSHISVTGRSPWGSGTLATTNSIIRISTKK